MTAGRRRLCASLALAAGILGTACGKKGPPIAPIVRIPAAVDKIEAARLGNDVYVTLTVPATNIDESVPVDIARIDVYGYTGRAAPASVRWAKLGNVIASIPVAVPPESNGTTPPAPSRAPSPDGALPGTPVTVRDTLTPDEFEQGRVFTDPRRPELAPLPGVAASTVMRRFYLAIPFSRRGRPGPPGAQAEMVLTALPDPPSDVRVSYSASIMSVSWEPSGGLLGFLLDKRLPAEAAPFITAPQPSPAAAAASTADASVPLGPTMYNVYREIAPDPLDRLVALVVATWSTPPPAPVNPSPLTTTSATDQVVFGREQCYAVRAQRGVVLSEPSARACLTPVDVFPPAAPVGVAAVPSEGGISLIWEPNGELDLGGYLVLRREPGDATLRQLTGTPITEARYRDATVQPGTRYIYSVVAVDSRLPLPNVSVESERVEETAR
jgi:hypothetical protein